MSRYGKIESGFWQNPRVRELSERGRYLLTYLLSCPHGNSAGCFVLRNGYIADDLAWPSERVAETISELSRNGFIERDDKSFLLRIVGWWGHNTIENPNVAKHVAKEINALPNCQVKQRLIAETLALETVPQTVAETLSKLLPEQFRNQEPNLTELEPNQSKSPAETPLASAPREEDQALEAYNVTAKRYGWPEARKLNETRRRSLKARLADSGGIGPWREAMARAARSDFLTGRAKRSGAHESWAPNLDFFLQSSSFTKLIEGFYDNKGSSAPDPEPVSREHLERVWTIYLERKRDGRDLPKGVKESDIPADFIAKFQSTPTPQRAQA